MNRIPPTFFDPIRQAAERRWQQLEADPELAGPWRQLFKQVQSPRHVLSELLQNADDAGATEASARVRDGEFEFTHNGEDFQADQFASLCRFGYSNKRSLHTIGFRGIGFKSVFSLGSTVSVQTQTLDIYFEEERFTLPHWRSGETTEPIGTRISVNIQDDNSKAELHKNLEEWKRSPVSLLFFKNIRKLTLNNHELFWQFDGAGPVRGSDWYCLNESPSERFLLASSEEDSFPADCLAEIRQERILGADIEFTLPPARVELVLGADAGIYVVLPTAVRPDLPFACNGPFMQDPARVKIKDPEISPTNRWLLGRVGRLAAECMCTWLSNNNLDLEGRACAYQLLPSGIRTQQGIERICAEEVEDSFFKQLEDRKIVLSQAGSVEGKGRCIAIDKQAQDIWPDIIFTNEIDPAHRLIACREIPSIALDALYRMGQIEKVNRSQFCSFLRSAHPPHPGQEKLLALWAYVSGEFSYFWATENIDDIAIVPITGKDCLYPSRVAVRLSRSTSRLREKDIDLIASHALILDKEWLEFLQSEEGDYPLEQGHSGSIGAKKTAITLLQQIGLSEGEDTSRLIEKVLTSILHDSSCGNQILIRLAHICAKLDCRAPKNFLYVTQSGAHRFIGNGVCLDKDSRLKALLCPDLYDKYFLADAYGNANDSCTREEWDKWISLPKTGLKLIPPLERKERYFANSSNLLNYISEYYGRKLDPDLFPFRWKRPYPSQSYTLIDHDLPSDLVRFWRDNNSYQSSLAGLVRLILELSLVEWINEPLLQIFQSNTNGSNVRLVEGHSISSSWLTRIQKIPCIPDSRGSLCKPCELLRRSEETQPLIGIERFVEKQLDNPKNELILGVLGVSAALPGPQSLLSLLETVSSLDTAPLSEVIRLYEQLDKLLRVCGESDRTTIIEEFGRKRLILTEQGSWSLPSSVFISGDGLETTGIHTVLNSLRSISLWRQIGVSERPNTEIAVRYIKSIQIGSNLEAEAMELAKVLLNRFPNEIVSECKVWLSLSGALENISTLIYGLASEEISVSSLFDSILGITADLRFCDSRSANHVRALAGLKDLENSIEYQLERRANEQPSPATCPPWLDAFGLCVGYLYQDQNDNELSVFHSIRCLNSPCIAFTEDLRLVPVIEKKPAGRPVAREGAIVDNVIYVKKLQSSRLASLIPVVIGEYFGSPEMQSAASYCYERPRDLILDYFKANFGLSMPASTPPPSFSRNQAETSVAYESIYSTSHCLLAEPNGPEAVVDPFIQVDKTVTTQARGHTEPSIDLTLSTTSEVLGASRLSQIGVDVSIDPGLRAPNSISETNSTQSGFENGGLSNLSECVSDGTAGPSQISIIRDYAISIGMHEINDSIFQDDEINKIVRRRQEVFPWVLISQDGVEIKKFLVKAQSLFVAPLEIDSVAFGLLERSPEFHSLLLPSADGSIQELTGHQILKLIESGEIKVYPASYRLSMT